MSTGQASEQRGFSLTGSVAAVLVLLALLLAVRGLSGIPGEGRALAFSALAGGLFGWLLQRSRFCFFCVTRDWFERADPRGLLGILAALAIGLLGYYAVFGAFLPDPASGRLPPGAHIGPVSWVLPLAALVFGLGMAVSGSCISAHLYRLGEGNLGSLLALFGAGLGFVLGFLCWNTLYLRSLQGAPVIWLPAQLGYGGSLLLQLAVLAALATWLARRLPPGGASPGGLWSGLLLQRWPAWAGGLLIGTLAALAYLRTEPLGVTAELGSLARTAGDRLALLPGRMEGLDGFSGCATVVKETLLSSNGVFVLALIAGALLGALPGGAFRPRLPGAGESLRLLAGGVMMGWGAMLALGCTVGTLLSGIMAGALSGWVFALFCVLGVWCGWRLRRLMAG